MKMNGETTLSSVRRAPRAAAAARKAHIDWDVVRQRLQENNERLERSEEPDEQALDQVWERRAAEIAQRQAETETGAQIELIFIRLGEETYGLDVRYVLEIRPVEQITRVPRVPDWMAGIVNLRGQISTVLDLQVFLGLPGQPVNRQEDDSARHLVVVETPDMGLVLLTDEVLSVEKVPIRQIQETNGALRGINPQYVRGVFLSHEQQHATVIVLDLPALLADKQLLLHEEIG